MQRRIPVQILLIDYYLFLREEILYYFFAAAIAGPMQWRALLEVLRVYIELTLV